MERKLGEIIEINEKKYKCKKGKSCSNCVFDFKDENNSYFCRKHAKTIGICAGSFRKDKTSIIFVELKKHSSGVLKQ